MSAKYKSPSFLLPNELNTSANPANDTGVNSMYSMDFDGSSDYINLGDSNSLSFGNGSTDSPFSISAWIYMNDATNFRILNKYNAPNYEYQFDLSSSDKLQFYIFDGSDYRGVGYDSALSINQWYHVAATYDGRGGSSAQSGMVLYVNGLPVNDITYSSGSYTAMHNTAAPVNIGKIASSYANGKIDEVAIFNRALNTTEIAALYGGTSPNIYPSNLMATNLNPVAYYPLGEQAQMQGYLGNEASSEWQFPNGVLQDYVMDFDGTDNINSEANISSASSFTASIWINRDDSATQYIYGQWIDGTTASQSWVVQTVGGIVYFNVRDASLSVKSAISTTSLTTGIWYNIIAVWTGSNIKLYINNSLEDTTACSSMNNPSTAVKLAIGSSSNNVSPFNGKISNAVIWNSDQSANKDNIYNNGSPQTTYTVTPQNWWKLNSDSVYTPSAPNYTTALDFTGTQHIKSIGTRSFNNFSISFWFNTATTPSAFEGYVSGQTGTGNDYSLGGFSIYYYNGGLALQSSNVNFNLSFTNNITLGNWNHIVVDIDNSNASTGGKLYLNGQLALETTNSGAYTYSFNNLWIGSRSTSGGNATNLLSDSQVSNVAVFNSNLTSSQVSTLFNFGTPETVASFSPYNHYKLNNNTTGVQDSGSAGNNAVITGTLNSVNTSVAVVPSWKIPSALTIPTINYTTALDFNRSEYDNLNTTPVTDFDTGDVSFSVWVFKDDGSTNGFVFNNSYNSGKAGITVAINDLERVSIKRSTRTHLKSTGYRNFGFTTNKWHQIAFTYDDSTHILRTFLDGQFKEEWSVPSGTLAASTTVCVGGREPGSGNAALFFDGKISNLTIFNSKLEDSDINTLYNSGQPLSDLSSFTTLATWWKLDNLTTGIQDSAGSINLTNDGATQVTSDVYAENIPVNGVSTTLPSTALQQSDLQFDSPYSNYSLSFDGAGDYISASASNLPTSDYTFSAWVKISSLGNYGILGYGDYSSVRGSNAFRFSSTELKNYWYGDDFNHSLTPSQVTEILNNWAHVAVIYDSSIGTYGQRVMYLNGNQIATNSPTGAAAFNLQNFTIGRTRHPSPPEDFNGNIDETSIFNYALSSAQVLEIYNNGRPNDLTTFSGTAPISWWRLGENAYFDNNSFIVPNSISGAPNGTGSGTITTMISADAPGTYANGVGENLDILDRVGEAPLSTSNSQSYNIIPSDISPYVPAYVGLQTDNIYSMSFDGANSTYFNAGQSLNIYGSQPRTISCWFNINSFATTPSGDGSHLLGYGTATTSQAFSLAISKYPSNPTHRLFLHVYNSANDISGTTQILENNWYLATVTYDGSTLKLYLNGNLQGSSSTSGLNTATSDFIIGQGVFSTWNTLNGQIDEVAIWDTPLNAGQIFNDLYQPTATATNKTADLVNNPNLPNPVAWYRMGD